VESVTVATGTGFTVIELVPVFPSLVAVTVTGPPTLTPVTNPFASTVAAVLFDDQVIVRPVRGLLLASSSVATSCCVAPTIMLAEMGLTVTVATGGGGTGSTVIELVPVFPSLVAVIVIGPPTLTAVTKPFASTVAAALFDDQVMVRPVSTLPPASLVTAESC